MENTVQVKGLRKKALERMDVAKQAGQMEEVIKYARMVQELDNLLRDCAATISRVSAGLNSRNGVTAPPEQLLRHDLSAGASELSPKARGRARRDEYLRRLDSKGVHLRKLKARAYETPSRKRVGIAYASEVLADTWWMGLPEAEYDILVLLCETSGGDILDFILPPDFVHRVWNQLTVSGKQREWHVGRSGPNYELEPTRRLGQLNQYLSRIELLR